MRGPAVCYVGNLPDNIKEDEIQTLFEKYGRIRAIDIKIPPRPPPFAFVEYEDPRDAEEAVRGKDGYDFYGYRLRVELAKGGNPRRDTAPPRSFRKSQTGFRVIVKNLPVSASWQDLKDHLRQVAKPLFTDVYRDRGEAYGVAEFETYDDMRYVIRKLDDTEFKNPFEKAYIRIQEDSAAGPPYGGRGGDRGGYGGGYGGRGGYGGGGYGGGRDRDDDRAGRDNYRDREREPVRDRSKDRSISRSRSRSRSSGDQEGSLSRSASPVRPTRDSPPPRRAADDDREVAASPARSDRSY